MDIDNMREITEKLREAVINYDKKAVLEAAQEVVNRELDPITAVEKGLAEGARVVGDKFDKLEVFLTDLMMAADAMKAGVDFLLSKVPKEKMFKKGTVLIGTVKGDIHDIGKNIVSALLSTSGFDVHDLGVDVPAPKFMEVADRVKADIIAISSLMTTTIGGQKDVIDYIKDVGRRNDFIIMVGGGATTHEWAEEIGADGYTETATEAVKLASSLVDKKR